MRRASLRAVALRADAHEIGRIMNQMAGWENRGDRITNGIYKGQRCWNKKEAMTVNDFIEL